MIRNDYDRNWEAYTRPEQEPSTLSLSSTSIEIMILSEVGERQMYQRTSLSSISSTDMEIVTPSETPKSKVLSSPRNRKEERRTDVTTFLTLLVLESTSIP